MDLHSEVNNIKAAWACITLSSLFIVLESKDVHVSWIQLFIVGVSVI